MKLTLLGFISRLVIVAVLAALAFLPTTCVNGQVKLYTSNSRVQFDCPVGLKEPYYLYGDKADTISSLTSSMTLYAEDDENGIFVAYLCHTTDAEGEVQYYVFIQTRGAGQSSLGNWYPCEVFYDPQTLTAVNRITYKYGHSGKLAGEIMITPKGFTHTEIVLGTQDTRGYRYFVNYTFIKNQYNGVSYLLVLAKRWGRA